jgi:hypothetical protein
MQMNSSDSDDGYNINQTQSIYLNDSKNVKKRNCNTFRREIIKA